MAREISARLLHGRWLHSREEDTDEEQIYRPAGFAFPPARGRDGFEFKADGSLAELGMGPTDRTTASMGKWQLDDDATLRLNHGGKSASTLKVSALSAERLAIKK